SVGKSHFRDPLDEHLASTPRIAATETTSFETNSNGKTLPWKILKVPAVMAVAGARKFATGRATRQLAARADFECESVLIAIDTVEEQDLGVRKNRLRMARGSCHRFPSLKHLMVKLFGSIQATTLHQNRGRALPLAKRTILCGTTFGGQLSYSLAAVRR